MEALSCAAVAGYGCVADNGTSWRAARPARPGCGTIPLYRGGAETCAMLASPPRFPATLCATVDGTAPRAGGILPLCAAGSSGAPIRSGPLRACAAARN